MMNIMVIMMTRMSNDGETELNYNRSLRPCKHGGMGLNTFNNEREYL